MPAAADTKFWTARPVIWVRWLIVASPPYDCQLVLVMKLTAVLNERWGTTAGMSVGLRGSEPWNRCSPYIARKETMLKPSSE